MLKAYDPQLPDRPRAAGRLRHFLGDRRGAAAIEFAFLAIPFFLILFSIIETSLIFAAELTLDQAVAHVARRVRIGEAAQTVMTQASLKQAICSETSFLLSCDKLQVDLQPYARYLDLPTAAPLQGGQIDAAALKFDLGGPNKIMALRAFYDWPIVTDIVRKNLSNLSSGGHLVTSVEVFRTEPYL